MLRAENADACMQASWLAGWLAGWLQQQPPLRSAQALPALACAMKRCKADSLRRCIRCCQRRADQCRLCRAVGGCQAAAAPILVDCAAMHKAQDATVSAAAAAAAGHQVSTLQHGHSYCFATAIAISRRVKSLAPADRRQGLKQADAGGGLQHRFGRSGGSDGQEHQGASIIQQAWCWPEKLHATPS